VTDGIELRFWAAVQSIAASAGRRLATFYLMDTSLNRNGWRVTDRAIEDALPTLLGKPLGCIPGYRINHVHEPLVVGQWVEFEKPDGNAFATAEITDGVAWERVSSGEWGPVSVVIKAHRVVCSRCGGDITAGPDEHVLDGEGHEIVESFSFSRVDFVADPAYPQAGLITLGQLSEAKTPRGFPLAAAAIPFEETAKAPEGIAWDADAAESRIRRWAGGPEKERIRWSDYRRAFAWYDRSEPDEFGSYKLPHHDIVEGRLSVVWSGVAAAMQALLGARGGVDIPAGDRRGVYVHLSGHYRQFGRVPPEYHVSRSTSVDGAQGPPKPEEKRERKEMEAQVAELQHEVETLKAENTELRERLEGIEAERRRQLVEQTLEARLRAGLAGDRKAEAERLKSLDGAALILLGEDAERVAERLGKATAGGPKAKYSAYAKSGFDAAVEDARMRLFGYSREAEG